MNVKVRGDRLKEIRRAKAIERQELAERSGVHEVTIARLELGQAHMRLKTARALARALDVDPADITGETVYG